MTIAFKHRCAHKNCVALTLHDDRLPYWVIWSGARDPKEVKRIAGKGFAMPTVAESEWAFFEGIIEPRLLQVPAVDTFMSLYGAEHVTASFVHPKQSNPGCEVHLSFADEDYRTKFIALHGGFGTRTVEVGKALYVN